MAQRHCGQIILIKFVTVSFTTNIDEKY